MGTRKSERTGLRKRSVETDDQEQRSVGQFIDRLGELRWKAQGPRKDYGEDYLVQIWDEGVPSGLSFYVQLKSTRNAELHKGKKTPNLLRYPLEVKDIEHWEVQSVPVVLVLWDVEKREGYWETIPRIVEGLEKEGKGWRKKEKVRVSVPVGQGTDDAGMKGLRWWLAKWFAPIILKNENGSTEVTFSFPATNEGTAAMRELEKALDEGTSTKVDGAYIASFQLPSSHERVYGRTETPEYVTVTPTLPADLSLSLRIEVESDDACVTLPYVEMRPVRAGRRHLEFTNEHQNLPLFVQLKLDPQTKSAAMGVRRRRLGRTIFEEREILEFLLAFSNTGNVLRMIVQDDKPKVLFEQRVEPQARVGEPGRLLRYYQLVDKLCTIQRRVQRVRAVGAFSLENGITVEDARAIDELFPIIEHGRVERNVNLRLPIDHEKSKDVDQVITSDRVTIFCDGGRVSLLGIEIDIGPAVMIVKDAVRFGNAYRDALAEARKSGRAAKVELLHLDVVEEYLNWLARSDRSEEINKIAAKQAGYFTLAQANAAGYGSEATLKAEEHLEDCGGNVFRFLTYPGSDHEDLVITWLQTEKQGVFSHDTALGLHELSDILPVRQHITVPPGWKPIEGMRLSPNTVLHYGTVEQNERAWMGPVPFTKPMRTLVDCIDDNLPPDILDQALADAYRRGMLSPGELQAMKLRKAKSA